MIEVIWLWNVKYVWLGPIMPGWCPLSPLSPEDTSCIGISWCRAAPPGVQGGRGRGAGPGRGQGTPWPRWWAAAPALSSSPRPRPGARMRLLTPASPGHPASSNLRPSPASRHSLLRLLKTERCVRQRLSVAGGGIGASLRSLATN